MGKGFLRKIILLFSIVVLFFPISGQGKEPIHVVFINPGQQGSQFWDSFVSFMQASAKDLEIDLSVVSSSGDHFHLLDLAKEVLTASKKPDYFISILMRNSSLQILQLAEKEKVPYFSLNTAVPKEDEDKIKQPREVFQYWIGQMVPDDYSAGYDLGELLITKAKEKGLWQEDGKFHLSAINGSRNASAATERVRGLEDALKKHPEVVYDQLVYTDWTEKMAYRKALGLLKRYPDTSIFWSAADVLAQGVIKAARIQGKKMGKDLVTGGVDWSENGIISVKLGEMEASFGGHFMEGAWALVLLYDYHHGKDFAEKIGTKIPTKMSSLTSKNLKSYLKYFRNQDWDQIDFKAFSLHHNPQQKEYRFNLESILEQVTIKK